VRIETRRPWSSVLPDSLRPVAPGATVIRVIGNGLVWDPQGAIVTVADLAQPGDSITVVLDGGVRRSATFIGQDAETGLSLIRVRGASGLAPAARGDSRTALQENAWVLTIGSQGRGPSRQLTLARIRNRLQTGELWRVRLDGTVDAALTGAGVMDTDGRVVGILLGEGVESAILPSSAPGVSLEYPLECDGPSESGWVMPLEIVERTVRFLLERKAGQGFLGVRVEVPSETHPEQAAAAPNLIVARVLPESPAARGGIRAGDRIVTFAGQPVRSWDQLTMLVAAASPERPVKIEIIRNEKPLTTTVQLADRGSMVWRAKQLALAEGRERQILRRLETLNQQLRLFREQFHHTR
jgi:serine protease Do